MANRFPLIVNPTTKKIEELAAGDNIDLTSSSIYINGSIGVDGEYLRSNGSGLVWDTPGDVYLDGVQTLTNKTFVNSIISGTQNTITNISNGSLIYDYITINGVDISLGGEVQTPDNNTTYDIDAIDGITNDVKIIRLTSGGNIGAGVTKDIEIAAGSNVTLSRSGDRITFNSSYVDTNTITRLKSASGGVFQSGDITIDATGSSTVSQNGNTITINSTYVDTITRLRGGSSNAFAAGDFTILATGASFVSQDGGNITISSTDTVTRVKGGFAGTFSTGDISIVGSGSATVSQTDNTIVISASDTNTVTRIKGGSTGSYESGDVLFTASGAASISQSGSTITITSTDTDTTYTADTNTGIQLSGTTFSLKNTSNLTTNRLSKWDNVNKQFSNSTISDDGTTVTVGGNLIVNGTTTTIDTQNLIVADAQIELRKGVNLIGADGGLQINRTTNANGEVTSYQALQWLESGGYWRTWNGSVGNRLVTETETQTLSNKTLASPTLTTPSLGIASATSINGLQITTTTNGRITVANNKTAKFDNTLTFNGSDNSIINLGAGGQVVYTTDSLSVFASTTSTQLRGVITDETGTGVLVFNQNPIILDSLATTSLTFNLLTTNLTSINAFTSCENITFGNTSGTGSTTIQHSLVVNQDTTLGTVVGDLITINGTPDFVNSDITIRGTSDYPIKIGRGNNEIAFNTRVGFDSLRFITTGSQNTAFGFEAARNLNSGAANTAFGYRALRNANVGTYNVALGRDAVLNLTSGSNNIGVGTNALGENTEGNNNICIGRYSGYGCYGSGNVLIGPADTENSSSATYAPPSALGDRQLVIGSGTGTWVRGDANFDVTTPNNFNVGKDLTVSGNLVVNGQTTSINSTVIQVDDKAIELGSVANTNFAGTVVSGSANITAVIPTTGLITGMVVVCNTPGITVLSNSTITAISGTTVTLSNPITGNGTGVSFTASGPSDTSADGGGIVLKGTTNKSLTWTDATDAWTSTENIDLASTKQYKIGNVLIASSTQIGPSTGSFSLGAGVTSSSLTSVGTLGSLTVTGTITANGGIRLGDNDVAYFGDGNDLSINHDGSNSYIKDEGTGSLYIQGTSGVYIRKADGSETMAGFTGDGAVELYYDNSKKFETTSSGITVSGTGGNQLALSDSGSTGGSIKITNASTGATATDGFVLGYDGSNNIEVRNYENTDIIFYRNNSEQARINSSGIALASGTGIGFGATTDGPGASSELFDDYEEGTYTPTFTPSGNGSITLDTSVNTFAYTKVGRLVTITGRVKIASISSGPAPNGSLSISLPFASSSALTDQAHYSALPVLTHDVTLSAGTLSTFLEINSPNATSAILYQVRDGIDWLAYDCSNLTGNNNEYFYVTGSYITDT